MTQNNSHDRDDERLAQLLRVVDADVPALDRERLDALRGQSADLFAAMEANRVSAPSLTKSFVSRRSPMMTFAVRGLLSLTASAMIALTWIFMSVPATLAGSVPFSEILSELRGAETLQFRLLKDGNAAEVWVRAPGLVRKEESPQRYEIAAGSRLWRVDETVNTVTESDSPWFLRHNKQIDLIGLLDVGVKDASRLLTARPVSRQRFEGEECFVYITKVESSRGVVSIEAIAEVTSKRLRQLTAWEGDLRELRANAGLIDQKPPLADMKLIAVNVPVADDKFVVSKSLTEDGRIGKVSDAQGIVVLRPMLAKRWTPVCRETLLKPGDWLRTELRGANAVKATLSSEVELTLGPGTLIEFVSPTQARIHSGQVQVRSPVAPRQEGRPAAGDDGSKDARSTQAGSPNGTPVAERQGYVLLAPRDGSRVFKPGEKQLVRVDRNEKLIDVPQTPVWLAGFEGTTNNESLGSLIVNLPDGRHEPLTVGDHKVSVEIRDQIARTTIEESFVNHTDGRLEGVFHFPLPQDASISGFGMWIGNDLVEADVVEKQRAREIYETILREKRDPGLLEWTGGNIFKARVFPIEARSEKRIKIVYTQVLPLRANRYRYSYGLRSELLRTKPLRELSLTVTVNSALPLKSVTCPTHSARAQQTAHSAQIEFAAQEYTPTRDFEVVCEIDGRQSDVIVVPHRRGEDGYFLVQLTPPAPEGNWQRELLPDGKPLKLVLLCDTSASMDSEKRLQQAEFVATVLSSLGAEDRFLLAAADVGTSWAFAEPVAATAENIAKARSFLDERISLGWTNLDRAFEDAMKKSPAGAHIVYVGDGIVSSGDSDPAAFVKRLGSLVGQVFNLPVKTIAGQVENLPHVHAVSVGNSFESVALKGIAAVGGGSMRSIGGEQTPQVVALEWLNEIAQPGLRDLNVEFRGLRVAAVYPDRLPNVAAGTQQILVGRYLPDGKDQQGEIIVTGMRGGEKVRYAARVNLKDAEAGNSFIPRLWARSHLDQLLAQGQSQLVQDDIIRLSEEFHIITPYTSLLVLETDADRERFGVQRRYEMRDGERFFAEGRDNANFDLLQQQMKRAGDWRLGLRRDVLRSLAGLGRNPRAFQQQTRVLNSYMGRMDWDGEDFGMVFGGAAGQGGSLDNALNFRFLGEERDSRRSSVYEPQSLGDHWDAPSPDDSPFGVSRLESLRTWDYEGAGLPELHKAEELSLALKEVSYDRKSLGGEFDELMDLQDGLHRGSSFEPLFAKDSAPGWGIDAFDADMPMSGPVAFGGSMQSRPKLQAVALNGYAYESLGRRYSRRPDYTSWINKLFPSLAPAPAKPVPVKPSESWPADAITLSKSLLRLDSLLKLEGGVELRRVSDTFDVRWNRRSSRNTDLALYSPSGWLTRSLDLDDQTLIEFCDAKERGVYSLAFLLGRTRAAIAQELKSPPLSLSDYSLSPLHESFHAWTARLEPAGDNLTKLILTVKHSTHEEHFTIDTAKHLLVKREWFDDGKAGGATRYEDFVEVAGSLWAKKATTTDDKGRKTAETTLDIQAHGKEPYSQRLAAELSAKPSVQFVSQPFVTLKVARQKAADGSAGFEDRLAMILHNATLQQWDELWKQVEAAEILSLPNKPGVRWLRTILLGTIRRNEEARQRMLAEAKKLAANRQQDELFLAGFVLNETYSLMGWPEYLEFVNIFKPLYDRQPAELDVVPQWQERLLQCHDGLSRHEDALSLRRSMTEKSPWHLHWQTDVANRLARAGQVDAAFAWLQKELDRPIDRQDYEEETLRSAFADLYRSQARWDDLLKFTTAWIARKPESSSYNSAYAQHLAALIQNDQLDTAYALVEQWLREARIDGKLAADQRARLETAINFANGQCYQLSFQRADERWHEPLAETIRFFVRHKHHPDIASRGTSQHYFLESDAADKLRGEFLSLLQSDAAKLTPAQISSLLGWTTSGRIELKEPLGGRKQIDASQVPDDVWKSIAAQLKERWTASQDKGEKHSLSESLQMIYGNRFRDTDLLPFLRERLAAAHPDFKAAYVSSLFEALLATNWSDEIEQEAFARLRDLSEPADPSNQLTIQVVTLHRLVDAMLANRQSAAESKLNDQGGQDKLTRQELAAKKAEIRKAARVGLAARLVEQVANLLPAGQVDNVPRGLGHWMLIEQLWLDVSLGQNLVQVEEECWKILGEVPPNVGHVSNVPDENEHVENVLHETQARQQYLDGLLKQRAFTTVMSLAARRNAAPAAIARVLKYIDAGIAQSSPVAPRQDSRAPNNAGQVVDVERAAGNRLAERDGYVWRNTKFRMLIALDRADDLERELREWIRTDVSTAPWRQMLARLVAERGKLDEAIQLFEACQKDKLLSAADYQMLADWYLVSNRRAAYERSRIEAFKQMPEHKLSNMLYLASNRWMQHDARLPSELDENTLFVAQALFEKSANPENYLWQHSNLYGGCRDFRLLRMLPDAVLGRSPQQIYRFLQTLQSAALGELRNEASADEILDRIKQLRAIGVASAPRQSAANGEGRGADAAPLAKEGALTTTDLRALDLLEAIVERKSSEVLNQPGPHIDACVASLQRAFHREWSEGEPRMMSHFLFQLGGLPHEKLKAEQLRELRDLQRAAPANSRDHLAVTTDLCQLLFWSYDQKGNAQREMEAEIQAYTQANNGVWPHLDNEFLDRFVSMLEGSNQHTAGENVLRKYLAKPANDEQHKWLHDRLMSLYNHALEHDGAVSLGTGRANLFGPIVELTRKELAAAPDENVRYNLVVRLVATFDIARRHQLPATAEAVRRFAFDELPALLKRQQSQYRNTATAPMHLVGEVLGPKLALQFVVERMEQYPQRLEIGWENSWNAFGSELGRRRHDSESAKLDIKELEPRVLKLAIQELKRELRTGENRHHSIYHDHYSYFWQAKANDFAKAAEEVLTERRTSGRRAMAVARYFWQGLERRPRAIEILLLAHKDGLLDESSQVQLVQWLHETKRWAESIPLLEAIVRDRPHYIAYRKQLMAAYYESQRPEQLAMLVHQTETHFHAGGRWTEHNVSEFARGCSNCNLREKAIGYFTEAIALHQRNHPGSGAGNSALSSLYQALGLDHSALGHTKEAVEAMSAAIVCWGPRDQQRRDALNNLLNVLKKAKDLDDYVKHLDAEAEKTGQDSPILRKAVGQTYQSRNEHVKAITQLQLAAELQPHDQEIHQALIACYDATQNGPAASKQLLKLIDLKRHELALYQQLAERLKDNEAEAERAATSIIESSPNEAESHAAMAELRQKQNRWSEAIPHWQRVAELRRLEPTGLLKLAEAQIHEKLFSAARTTVEKLQKTEWPSRFTDVSNQTRILQEQLPK